jgi:excisionase family DNA binding protein
VLSRLFTFYPLRKGNTWLILAQAETTVDEERRHMQVEITREWLSYKHAEELSGLSRTTLWRLVGSGEIKAARVGRAVRISRRSLEEYLERAAVQSGE